MERKHICCICGGNNFVKDVGELCINKTKKVKHFLLLL